MANKSLILAPLLLTLALFAGDASAADTSLALGEVAVPPASSGVDRAMLKTTTEGELRGFSVSKLRATGTKNRSVVVSMSLTNATQSPFGCTVNGVLRDGKTGAMLAIVEGRARSEGVASTETRKQVLRAAVRNAVNQIPEALGAN